MAWFGFGLAFPLFLLAFPYDSASVFLGLCLWIPLFLRVFLLVSACVSPCVCLGFSLFLLVFSLCPSLFLLVFLLVSACASLCFCLCFFLSFLFVFPSASVGGRLCCCVRVCLVCLSLLVFVACIVFCCARRLQLFSQHAHRGYASAQYMLR